MMPIWLDILTQLLKVLVDAVLTIGIPWAFSMLSRKIKDERAAKYLSFAEKTVKDTVVMINQTFVERLKADGEFNMDNQAEAFKMCKQRIMYTLGEDVKYVLADVVGDLDIWLAAKIEAAVVEEK